MWLKVDDRFYVEPAIIALSDGAFRLHVIALSWCADHLSDGNLTDADVTALCRLHRIHRPGSLLAELVEQKLWERVSSVYRVCTFRVANPSRETVLKRRELGAKRYAAWADRHLETTPPNASPNAFDEHPLTRFKHDSRERDGTGRVLGGLQDVLEDRPEELDTDLIKQQFRVDSSTGNEGGR